MGLQDISGTFKEKYPRVFEENAKFDFNTKDSDDHEMVVYHFCDPLFKKSIPRDEWITLSKDFLQLGIPLDFMCTPRKNVFEVLASVHAHEVLEHIWRNKKEGEDFRLYSDNNAMFCAMQGYKFDSPDIATSREHIKKTLVLLGLMGFDFYVQNNRRETPLHVALHEKFTDGIITWIQMYVQKDSEEYPEKVDQATPDVVIGFERKIKDHVKSFTKFCRDCDGNSTLMVAVMSCIDDVEVYENLFLIDQSGNTPNRQNETVFSKMETFPNDSPEMKAFATMMIVYEKMYDDYRYQELDRFLVASEATVDKPFVVSYNNKYLTKENECIIPVYDRGEGKFRLTSQTSSYNIVKIPTKEHPNRRQFVVTFNCQIECKSLVSTRRFPEKSQLSIAAFKGGIWEGFPKLLMDYKLHQRIVDHMAPEEDKDAQMRLNFNIYPEFAAVPEQTPASPWKVLNYSSNFSGLKEIRHQPELAQHYTKILVTKDYLAEKEAEVIKARSIEKDEIKAGLLEAEVKQIKEELVKTETIMKNTSTILDLAALCLVGNIVVIKIYDDPNPVENESERDEISRIITSNIPAVE